MADTRPISLWNRIISRLDGLLLFLLRATLICGILALGYLLYGIFSGGLFQLEDPSRFSPQKRIQLVQAVKSVGLFCTLNFLILVACSLLRSPDDPDVLALVILGGVLIGLGLPWLIGYQAHQSPWGHNEATQFLVRQFGQTGILIGVGLSFLLLRGMIQWIRSRSLPFPPSWVHRQPAPELPPKRKPTMFSPCWHLPYCRRFLLNICPAFKAKVKCWKFGRGCFCDQKMFDRLVEGLPTLGRPRAKAYARQEVAERLSVLRRRGGKDKPPCPRCFIFLEHQRLKHHFFAPLTYPLTALLIYLGRNRIWGAYQGGAARAAGLWQKLSFTGDVVRTTPSPIRGDPALVESSAAFASAVIYYIVLTLGAFLVLILLLWLVETAIFKWKL